MSPTVSSRTLSVPDPVVTPRGFHSTFLLLLQLLLALAEQLLMSTTPLRSIPLDELTFRLIQISHSHQTHWVKALSQTLFPTFRIRLAETPTTWTNL